MNTEFDRLGLCFFGADLEYGKMRMRPGHTANCFLIVEHTNDEVFVRKQALELLMACNGWFHIYGKQVPLWHRILDETDVLLHPNPEKFAVTAGYDDMDDFVNELDLSVHVRSLVPNDTFLLYDDMAVYRKVLRKLGLEDKPYILVREPLAGMTAEELSNAWKECSDIRERVSLYASVHNQVGWADDEIDDYRPGTVKHKEACRLYQSWRELEKTMCDQLIAFALEEGIPLPEGQGLMKKLAPVMRKYGFTDGNGWWIRKNEQGF